MYRTYIVGTQPYKKLFAFQASLTYIQQAKLQIIIYFQMYYKKSNYVGSLGTCCIKSNTAQHLPQLLVSFPSSNIIGTQFNASVTNNKVEDTPFPHLLIFFQLQLMAYVTYSHDLNKVAIQKMNIALHFIKNNLLESITFVVPVICNSVESKQKQVSWSFYLSNLEICILPIIHTNLRKDSYLVHISPVFKNKLLTKVDA